VEKVKARWFEMKSSLSGAAKLRRLAKASSSTIFGAHSVKYKAEGSRN